MTLVLSAIVAVLVVAVGLGAVKLHQDKTGNILIPALSLRAADDPGPDPFTDSVVLRNQIDPPTIAPRGASDRGVRAVSGTTPGLYGTTGSASCDTAALGTSLANDRAAGDAWASVFGIRRVDTPWYLNTLTPVVLTADTWVTNHAYRSGMPAPFQSAWQTLVPVATETSETTAPTTTEEPTTTVEPTPTETEAATETTEPESSAASAE
ncbi:DUF6777 domain-containing protein [Gordonia sp. (in: high G+C Gram-positive bacteria)]|uniref:DUF6777 domain-containing protein n=1 Tax=Gordonia sp. (in: high G+C Gram-positive bacteria) TaxID=84139 RepID=UPI003F9C805F